jgi:hypothetical protein
MILVASPSKPFTYTAKMTARRQAIINDYDEEIQDLYEAVQATTQSDLPLPTTWNLEETLKYTREVVTSVMNASIEDDDDFFRFGCDRSVKAIDRLAVILSVFFSFQFKAFSQCGSATFF